MSIQPLNQDQKMALTAMILKTGKSLAPDRFPRADHEVTTLWAETLNGLYYKFPFPTIWKEAVMYWCLEKAGEKMITPADLKSAVHTIRDQWEKQPQRRQALNQWRDARSLNPVNEITGGEMKCL